MALFANLRDGRRNKKTVNGKLSPRFAKKVIRKTAKGNRIESYGNAKRAEKIWRRAYNAIPEPKNQFEQSVWLEIFLGDIFFSSQLYAEALPFFQSAYSNISGKGKSNPYVHLRLGACLLETGQHDEAIDHLWRAYQMEDRQFFRGTDLKYLDFLKGNLNLSM